MQIVFSAILELLPGPKLSEETLHQQARYDHDIADYAEGAIKNLGRENQAHGSRFIIRDYRRC
jgi:hypothetical protein